MIAILIDKKLDRFENQIKYSFNFIFRTLGYEYKFVNSLKQIAKTDIVFYYSENELNDKYKLQLGRERILFFIPCFSDLLIPGKLSKNKLKKFTRKINLSDTLPIICEWEFPHPIIYLKNEQIFYVKFNFDLIANIFFNLSGYETSACSKDEKGRIPDEEFVNNEFFYFPYVNAILWFCEQVIKDAIIRTGRCFLTKKEMWPQAEKFGFAVSHQVDKLQKWTVKSFFKSFFQDILFIFHLKYIFKNLYSKIKYILTNIEEYWNFSIINQIEDKHKISSTFFIGTEREVELDVDYDLDDKDLLEEIQNLLERKKEIALLASYRSAKNDILSRQKSAIAQLINKHRIGVRQICFCYFPDITSEYHYKNNFFYDSSQALLSKPGFKFGIAVPYNPYAVIRSSNLSHLDLVRETVLELPLSFRVKSLKTSPFHIIDREKAEHIFQEGLKSVKRYAGFFNIDFTVADFAEIDYLQDLYDDILGKVRKEPCFKGTLKQIADWWKKREKVQITDSKDEIIIYFPDHLDRFVLTVLGNNSVDSVENDKNREDENQIFLPYFKKQNTFQFNGTKVKFDKERIYFSDVKSDTRLRIKLSKKEIKKEK
ncbi:MAG: hypothetical protein SVM86_03790 [Candidatus Cloacimonadota bacterium]|nr:hypothetical protein [Candidatus Cloacimonadota bacterium]